MTDRWPKVRLSELVTKVGSGATPTGGSESYIGHGIPLIRSMNVRFEGFSSRGLVYLNDTQAAKLSSVEVEDGDVLLNITGASIGRVTVAPAAMAGARVNQHVSIIRCAEGLESGYLHRYLASPAVQQEIFETESGATRQALTKAKILNFSIPLPPLNEQRRIVAKIEALQARSEAAKQALDAIGPLLEKFRQSVLAAAFRGDLTASWREQHPDVEPASALLERIRVERKARFIAAAGDKVRAKAEAKARAAGKSWTEADATAVVENARAKAEAQYVEPEPVDASELPELPAGWCWASLDELAYTLDYGTSKKSEDSGRVPVLRMGNLQGGNIVWDDLKYTDDEEDIIDYALTPNTVLFNRTNSPELVGKSAIYRGERTAIYAGYLIRISLINVMSPDLLNYSLNSPSGRAWCWDVKTDGVSQSNISASKLRTYPVPVPPLAEQRELEKRIRSHLAGLDTTSSLHQTMRAQLDQLNQSILAKAFRGELVPQDPNDEPASVLLERIRAERTTSPAPTKKPKPKPAVDREPTPPEPAARPAPKPASTPKPTPEQLDLLVHVPPERVPIEEETTEVMAALRRILANQTDLPRDAALRILAESLGYQRISLNLRKRLDGHLRAAVRRRILEPGHAELLRLATHRVEHYSQDELTATLRTISRRNCVYEREELARSLLDHLGFRRMTATAKQAIESALDAAIDNGTFENLDSERLRRR